MESHILKQLNIMQKKNDIKVSYYESSVFKLFIRDIVKKQFSINSFKKAWKNIVFRIKVPFIKNKTIIMGMAPYDFRILYYQILVKNNNFIYHTSHPFWNDDKTMPRKPFVFKNFFKQKWKFFLNKPKIVVVTKHSFYTLKERFETKKIYQIYHSVNCSNFTPIKHKDNNKFNIIFVGKFLYEKGLDTILELVKMLDKDKFHFHFVGDGEYKYKIEELFNYKNVTYYGWISDKKKLAKIYQKGDVFLNPSIKTNKWQELFGLVNIEAMASGLVVIASNHIGPSEIIRDGYNGFLVEEKNAKQIENIINNLYSDREKYNEISKNAVKRAKDFSIENISKQWEEVING